MKEIDSENACKHTHHNGVIVWHDYGMIKDISRVVNEFSKKMDIKVIKGTRLAIGKKRLVGDKIKVIQKYISFCFVIQRDQMNFRTINPMIRFRFFKNRIKYKKVIKRKKQSHNTGVDKR